MKDERVYLLHAIDSIDAIQSYTVDGRDAFFADPRSRHKSELARMLESNNTD